MEPQINFWIATTLTLSRTSSSKRTTLRLSVVQLCLTEFGSSDDKNLSRKTHPALGRVWNPVLAMKGDKNSLHVFPPTSGPPDTRTEEPGTGPSRWNTPPHACDAFTLEQVFGPLWFAACPCARGATDRSISARRSLELNNEGHNPFIQPLGGEVYSAWCLRFSHRIDPALNVLRSDAQNSKHLDPEGLVALLVQPLQPGRYAPDSSGSGIHTSGGSRPTRSHASRTCLRRMERCLQTGLLIRKESQFSVQHAKAAKWLIAGGFPAVQRPFRCSDQSRR